MRPFVGASRIGYNAVGIATFSVQAFPGFNALSLIIAAWQTIQSG